MKHVLYVVLVLVGVGCAAREPSSSSDSRPAADGDHSEDCAITRASDTARRADQRAERSLCEPWEWTFQGHCYAAVGLNWMDYATARQLCVQSGGAPASITSAAENALVLELLPRFAGESWIGLKRTGDGATDFAWESGEQLSYANWAADEPNNVDGQEHCGSFMGPALPLEQRGTWIDQPCASNKRDNVVCERDPGAVIVH